MDAMRKMDALRSKLHKHQTTRRLSNIIAPEDTAPELDDNELRLRRGLQLQRTVTDQLLGYIAAVTVAFDTLADAQATLRDGGISDLVEVGYPGAGTTSHVAKALLAGFLDARGIVCSTVVGAHGPLETVRATLAACSEDLKQSDLAMAELSRYSSKMEALADETYERGEKAHDSPQVQAKFARNREKLRKASVAASVAQLRARDSLQLCTERREHLCELAGVVIGGTAEALRLVATKLVPVLASASQSCPGRPFEQAFSRSEGSSMEARPPPGRAAAPEIDVEAVVGGLPDGEATNPFEEDLQAAEDASPISAMRTPESGGCEDDAFSKISRLRSSRALLGAGAFQSSGDAAIPMPDSESERGGLSSDDPFGLAQGGADDECWATNAFESNPEPAEGQGSNPFNPFDDDLQEEEEEGVEDVGATVGEVAAPQVDRRRCSDGAFYTKEEFLEHFGAIEGQIEWDIAKGTRFS